MTSRVESEAWLPISSAPKDGTRVLLAYSIHGQQCMTVGWFTTGWFTDGCWRDEGGTDLGPMHWMPLPLPPQSGAGK